MTILVTGGRGTVAQAVIARLHAAGAPVRAASARPDELTVPVGVETAELVLDRPATFAPALRGVRRVFLYPEPADVEEFVKTAEAAGVEHVVLLSSSTAAGPGAEDDPLAHHNLTVERALAASRLAWTFLRPDAFAGNALHWAHALTRSLPVRLPFPGAQVAAIHPHDIADVAVEALTGDAFTGRAVTLTGPESLTFREQLAVIADVTGQPVTVEEISRAEAEQQMTARMPAAYVASLLDLWEAACDGPAALADTTATLLGRPARTFRQWAEENAHAFMAPREDAQPKPRPIGYWLRRADKALTGAMDALLADHGLTRLGWQVLNVVADEERATDARVLEVMAVHADAATLTAVVEKAVAGDWLTRPAPGRLALTGDGRARLTEVGARVGSFRELASAGISPEEYRTAMSVLERLAANAEAALPQGR
ncbi:NAD(P)H-binding protein [Streptomyces sp. NPDC049577]|uniref:NAD(P)H-binding protein n=1 Tax=Streptomyces sp. NPDC049577 TaxID=3155153 RepID=UPI00341FAFD3